MSIQSFRSSYETSPIILVDGLAKNVSGGMLPIISLTQSNNFQNGTSGNSTVAPDSNDLIAHFKPLPGGTLQEYDYGRYPFANQTTAANAVIAKPLRVSLLMIAPAPNGGGYTSKITAFSSLKSSLDQHIQAGGTFTVATPAYVYTNCILLNLRDVTGGEGVQVQQEWQWDFEQPLLTIAAAAQAHNNLMSKISNGSKVQGDPPAQSGIANTQGNPSSGVSQSAVPALRGSQGGFAPSSSGAMA